MNTRLVKAILMRNLLSYFNNPTGYVFICLFVVLSSFAAFWPNEFFNANLANLDQLNRYLPAILLVFIPAITMSIWADERRQGTDELLLTLPANDLEVVVGKYLAAVAVYSVALMFSFVCNLLILRMLGNPDLLLFASNYFGYWLVGLAMLATGMVASFFTANLTVAFILGVVFNAPLVMADMADAITGSPEWTLMVKRWSLAEQFRDFGRGVISLSATMYFLMIVAVMLYFSMVLIGRRHWAGGRDGRSLLGHYLVRAGSLIVAAVALVLVVETFDLRGDVTAERSSSLAPQTIELLRNLDTKNRTVQIEAYVSPTVPDNYVQTRLNLLNYLREFEKLGGGRIQVRVTKTEPTTEVATTAEQQYGIGPQTVSGRARGVRQNEKIFLGVAVTCGLEKVVIPFFYRGLPMEYELIRSICTVAQEKRKRLGVVQTDAKLFGGMDFDMTGPRSYPRQPLIDELEKQYEVVKVDPTKPIERFDALLVVQPSSLPQPQLYNLIDAIQSGQPTAIFEDPLPVFFPPQQVVGTTMEKRGPMGQSMGDKGDIQQLWKLLGVTLVSVGHNAVLGPSTSTAAVIWQDWNPYPKLTGQLKLPEFVFIGPKEPGATTPFNEDDPITSGLQELWFPFPGAIAKLNTSKLKFVELITTGDKTGLLPSDQAPQAVRNDDYRAQLERDNIKDEVYTLAAHITGDVKSNKPAPSDTAAKEKDDAKAAGNEKDGRGKDGNDKADKAGRAKSAAAKEAAKQRAAHATNQIDVVLVSDIDVLSSQVFDLWSHGEEESGEEDFGIHFDNVVFVLNVLDELAKDPRFIEIRKRRPVHRTLTTIENRVEDYKNELDQQRKDFEDDFNKQMKQAGAKGTEAENDLRDAQAKLAKYERDGVEPPEDVTTDYKSAIFNKAIVDQQIKNIEERLHRDHDRQVEIFDRQLNSELRQKQNEYKLGALLLPPILPFIVAVFVFFNRRAQEREGSAKSRLR